MENSLKLGTDLQHKIDTKTKPLGALGVLERLAFQIGTIQNSLSPCLKNPSILLFASDHGIAKTGVSPYPQEVTAQMVLNFARGGAAINVFAKQHNLQLQVIDVGVHYDFPADLPIRHEKIAKGTQNFLEQPAMNEAQATQALSIGARMVNEIHEKEANVVGFGEMGISNTSSAALLMHLFTQIPLAECVGKGTGLDEAGVERKKQILQQAWQNNPVPLQESPLKKLLSFGGFEIAAIVGGIVEAYKRDMVIMIDGFIVTSALLVAHAMLGSKVLDNCIFTHTSGEQGHQKMLDFLNARPILQLDMRLGEGTGCALAYPIIQASVNFLNDMASFEQAGVADKNEG